MITYNVTISASGTGKQRRRALALLDETHPQGIQANEITYTATFSASDERYAPGAAAWAVPAQLTAAIEVRLPARDGSYYRTLVPPHS